MRHHFQHQPDLQITPIEKIRLPLKSRDELPPILAGLQWIWMHPTLKAEIFALLEAKILAGKKATGRTGMDLWQILVLGVVRLGLAADWDRLEHIANYDTLVRQMLGLPALPWADESKQFGHQTVRDNVALLDDELLQQINARIAADRTRKCGSSAPCATTWPWAVNFPSRCGKASPACATSPWNWPTGKPSNTSTG